MAKKEIIAFDPPTEEEIMLIQPNNVTFGQYNVSEWQENLLTLIGDKIQKHMTREEELPRDLFNQPYVVIMCDEAGGKNNKNKVLKEAIDMLNKRFSFRWLHPKMKKEIETTGGSVITNIHNIKGTNQTSEPLSFILSCAGLKIFRSISLLECFSGISKSFLN